MCNEKLLTICIPCYNVSSYIEKTIESLLSSKYLKYLDILFINDGSNDATENNIVKYIDETNRDTFSIINKKNGGYGSVFNIGIEKAMGKYFCLLDGDDWYNTFEFDKLIYQMLLDNEDTDLFIVNHDRYNIQTQVLEHVNFQSVESNKIYTIDEFIMNVGYDKYLGIPSIFSKTSIWKENNLKLDEVKYHVDMEYSVFYIPFIKTCKFIDVHPYQYRVGNINSGSQIKSLTKYMDDHIIVMKTLFKFYNTNTFDYWSHLYIKDKLFRMIKRELYIMIKMMKTEQDVIRLNNTIDFLNNKGLLNCKELKNWKYLKIKKKWIYILYGVLINKIYERKRVI